MGLRKKIFLAVVLFLVIIPIAVSAAGVIPCATTEHPEACTLCHFVVGFKNLIDWGFTIVAILAIVALFFAGVTYIVSFGDETMMTKAKGFIKSTLIGFAVIFGGWLIVTLTMTVLSAKKTGDTGGVLGIGIESWNKFTCDTKSSAGEGVPIVSVPNGTGTDGNCTTITTESICKGAVGCKWNNNKCEIDSNSGKCDLTKSQKDAYSSGVICCVTTNKSNCSEPNVCKYASISLNQGCSDVCGSDYATKIDKSNCQSKLGY